MLVSVVNKMKINQDIRFLVTGAHGLLGQALVKCLQDEGFTKILTPSRLEMNLFDERSTNNYIFTNKPQIVIHLAATVFGLGGNRRFQLRAIVENSMINNNLFNAFQKFPPEHVFFAGTAASYPYPYIRMPLVESDFFNGLPHQGEFGYGMAKRHAYAYLHLLSENMFVNYTYGIFTNLYGPNDRFDIQNGHVIPSLIAKAYFAKQNNLPLDIWGDGNAKRDFLYIFDAARAIITCLKNLSGKNSIINIASGTATSISEIVNILVELAKLKEVNFEVNKPVGIPIRMINNEKLLNLGFKQFTSIYAGLAATYNWYINNLGIKKK